ncbi:MAG: alpha amylase N-terminal ig-like domain-containing protein [Planctomycetota bacterium]
MPRHPFCKFTLGLALLAAVSLCLPLAAREHTFTYEGPSHARTVSVAGSFNGWSRDANPMQRNGNVWTTTLELADGVHYYKFVVNGDQWMNDPASMREFEEADGHGGVNSAVLIGVDGRDFPEAKPNHINTEAMAHDPSTDAVAFGQGRVMLTLRTQAGDAERVFAQAIGPDGKPLARTAMHVTSTRLGFDYFQSALRVTGADEALHYRFVLNDGRADATFDDAGQAFTASSMSDFETPAWAREAVWYQIFPERFRNGDPSNDPGQGDDGKVLLPWTSDWWVTHTKHGEVAGDHNFYTGHGNVWRRRYGGDIQGVQEKLPYLRSLGVNAIYFNPVFEGESMHKYDASDFRHIDDNFGVRGDLPVPGEGNDPEDWKWSASDRVFLEFMQEARKQGFRVVIDGVFNHVGTDHFAFQNVLKNGRRSQYADWFYITDWGNPGNWGKPDTVGRPGGIQYNAWDGPNGALPAFAKDPRLGLAPGPRQHIFDITRRWMDPNGDGDPSDGIDGWRLDVPGDIPHPFWRDWRELVKSINPDAYITGEVWSFAHPWLEGDQFDAVMNYQFAMPTLDFFADRRTADPPSRFLQRLTRVATTYAPQVAFVNQNLFNSHDTDRMASMFVNPDRNYDQGNRLQDGADDYSRRAPNKNEWQRIRQALVCQMTFKGAPMTYYGDEAGMWGPDDPSDRMPMIWPDLEPYKGQQERFNHDVFRYYQRMIAMRQALRPLRDGLFRPVFADDSKGIAAYSRDSEAGSVMVVFNRSPSARTVTLPIATERGIGRLVDVADRNNVELTFADNAPDARPILTLRPTARQILVADGEVTLEIKPYGYAVLADPAIVGR